MKNKRKLGISLKTKQNLWGYIFCFPFIVGFVFLFIYPFIQSIIFSLSELQLGRDGYSLNFVGLENYHYSLFVHTDFLPQFTSTSMAMLRNVPFILVFSFFIAVILNQNFRGRFLARAIFFLPVIISSGAILMISRVDYMSGVLASGTDSFIEVGGAISRFAMQLQIPEQMLGYIRDGANQVENIVRLSAIQIIIFLAGLQSIPSSLYEAAKVEGATGWESFWKITLPLLSPLILTNIVYTVVDSFTGPDNKVIRVVQRAAFGAAGYGVGTAMAWIYLFSVAIFLLVTVGLISRKVFYIE